MKATVLNIFSYRFYVKEFLIVFFCYLFMEQIFSWLFIPVSSIKLAFEKIMSFCIYGFMLYSFFRLKPTEKVYVVLFTLLMMKLVFESLFGYGTVFQQLTMFYVLFPVVYALFIKYISRLYDLDLLEFLAKFYLFTYIIFMVVYGRGFSFSLDSIEMDDYGPFSGDSRIIHAGSIYMMILPFLWYLDRFMTEQKIKFLAPLLFCFLVILLHQHRSVWSSAIFAVIIYLLARIRTNPQLTRKVMHLAGGAVVMLLLAFFFISNLSPGFIDFLADRFSEIFDPAKEGSTGNFRIEQREVYFELFLERPLFGWTFEGFEMPNPLVDWWPEKTGQHFHEGYMEMLFYHGIVGLLFKYSLLLYLVVKVFSKKLTGKTIILISFSLAGLLFSFSYVPTLIFWGHVGLCLYYLEKDQLNYNRAKTRNELHGIKSNNLF